MAEIIKQGHRVHNERYSLSYTWNDAPGCGFGFDCNENGLIDANDLLSKPVALESFVDCILGKIDVSFDGIKTYNNSYFQPTIIRCSCGEELEVPSFTNECDCGALYNSFGQSLAPRDQWEEEY